ncbi:MAG: hypothetical protein AAFM92_03220 [Pseudomonadota bacterium]
MSAIDAQNALLARLQGMPDAPAIAYPNGPVVKLRPRIVVQFPAAAQTTRTIKGCVEGTAEMIARIEVDQHCFAGAANDIAVQILARFSPVLRLSGVTIIEAPSIQGAFSSDGVYHLPVIIRGRFYQ